MWCGVSCIVVGLKSEREKAAEKESICYSLIGGDQTLPHSLSPLPLPMPVSLVHSLVLSSSLVSSLRFPHTPLFLLTLSLSRCHALSLAFFHYHSLTLSRTLARAWLILCPSLSIYLSLSTYIIINIYTYICVSLSLSIYRSHSFSPPLLLSLARYLSQAILWFFWCVISLMPSRCPLSPHAEEGWLAPLPHMTDNPKYTYFAANSLHNSSLISFRLMDCCHDVNITVRFYFIQVCDSRIPITSIV